MRTKSKRRKEPEKNGGTWPKARLGVTSRHSTGTVMHQRRYDMHFYSCNAFMNFDQFLYEC